MINRDLITELLGIERLNSQSQILRDDEGKEVEKFRLIAYWAANIRYSYDYAGDHGSGNITMALIYSQSWTRAVLYVPALHSIENGTIDSTKTLPPIEINNWYDPTLDILTSMNIVPMIEDDISSLVAGQSCSLHMEVGTNDSHCDLYYHENFVSSVVGRLAVHRLIRAVSETLWYLMEQYDDNMMMTQYEHMLQRR